jgi:hypothetical protein
MFGLILFILFITIWTIITFIIGIVVGLTIWSYLFYPERILIEEMEIKNKIKRK